jgi:hypothetical protein
VNQGTKCPTIIPAKNQMGEMGIRHVIISNLELRSCISTLYLSVWLLQNASKLDFACLFPKEEP